MATTTLEQDVKTGLSNFNPGRKEGRLLKQLSCKRRIAVGCIIMGGCRCDGGVFNFKTFHTKSHGIIRRSVGSALSIVRGLQQNREGSLTIYFFRHGVQQAMIPMCVSGMKFYAIFSACRDILSAKK